MDKKEKRRFFLIAITTLFLLLGSYFVIVFAIKSTEDRRNRDLNDTLDKLANGIEKKFIFATDLLYSLRGVVNSDRVSPNTFKSYFLASDLEYRYPGVYSIAYIERVPKANLIDFENKLKLTGDEKYKDYAVFPTSNNADYYPIKYLYTNDPDISTLLGFDLRYVEKIVMAFTKSVVSDKPVVSDLIHLDTITPNVNKSVYEAVLPVYTQPEIKNFPIEERKKYLIGFVSTWITPASLKVDEIDLNGIAYNLYSNDEKFLSVGEIGQTKASISKNIDVLNKTFRVEIVSDKNFRLSNYEEAIPTILFVGLVLINVFWFVTVYNVLSARKKAIELADMATKDLKKFKQAVDGVSDHVIISDPDGIIIYANEAATKITGYSTEEMVGKRPSLWGGQMSKEFYRNFWNTIKNEKKPFWGQVKNRRKNGELYETELRVSPILDQSGELIFFVGIEKDLSKFKAIEKMKIEFISLASHQLRTPLSAVKWFSEMLLNGDAGKLTKVQSEFIEKINQSNEREIQLVNSLLNVSRIESGRIVVVPKKTDLGKLVDSVVSSMKVNASGTTNTIKVEIDKNVSTVEIDPDLIKHVYQNLLSNSVKYSNNKAEISVKVYLKGENVISEISDNGIGIPRVEQKRIFDKFFRSSNALKKETEGNGLGLYLSKTIVESSGGKLWFTSTEGVGSVFKFSLPVKFVKNPIIH